MTIDMSGPVVDSLEDTERLDKATSTGRPWVESSAKMHVCKLYCIYVTNPMSLN